MIGNGAIALGALSAGISLVAGYPGTPSSEIIDPKTGEVLPDGEEDPARI